MKDQYVCDIGDYGKYSLLRAFLEAGVKVGINWYLTDKDGSSDGKFKDYLKKDKFRKYDPVVFDALKQEDECGNLTVNAIQNSNILPGASFYSDSLSFVGTPKEREEKRSKWLHDSFTALKGAELIFLDPDNGLLVSDDPKAKNAEKYVLPQEIRSYWEKGFNVVYYCHRGRRKDKQWQDYMCAMYKTLPEVKILVITYHKGTQRSYVFLVHKMQFDAYKKIINKVLNAWGGVFTDERVENPEIIIPIADREFTVYNEQYVTLNGSIKDGCLHLESCVYGEDYDSEKYYDFTEEDTRMLFTLISFDDFIRYCKEGHLMWMETFLQENDIHPKTFCY